MRRAQNLGTGCRWFGLRGEVSPKHNHHAALAAAHQRSERGIGHALPQFVARQREFAIQQQNTLVGPTRKVSTCRNATGFEILG